MVHAHIGSERWARVIFRPKPNVEPLTIIKMIQAQPRVYALDGQDKLRFKMSLEGTASGCGLRMTCYCHSVLGRQPDLPLPSLGATGQCSARHADVHSMLGQQPALSNSYDAIWTGGHTMQPKFSSPRARIAGRVRSPRNDASSFRCSARGKLGMSSVPFQSSSWFSFYTSS